MLSEISIDCFAGGGGASCGIALATGRSPAIAINHWDTALSVHEANHPTTVHLTEDIWAVDPREAVAGRPVSVAWFSPDCTHHSRAKGGKPRSNKLRGLADAILPWAEHVQPRLIVVENVPEFAQWGPLDDEDFPIAARKGEEYRRWFSELQSLGYTADARVLAACDFGTPTTRRRRYVVARRGRELVRWPEPTHGPGRAHPYRTAAEIIDWSLPCPSIFERKRPLADATLARIARGIRRFVLESASPFIVKAKTHGGGGNEPMSADSPLGTVTASKRGEFAVVAPYLVHVSNGERPGQAPRVYDSQVPLGTVVAGGIKQGLVTAFLARHFGGRGTPGAPATAPLNTITAQDHHALVAASLVRYQGTGDAEPVDRPLGTLTARDRYGLVAAFLTRFQGTSTGSTMGSPVPTVTGGGEHLGAVTVTIAGEPYAIVDIGMRMLTPRELARAQGFPDDYVIDRGADGRRVTRTDQVRLIGNSVCQQVAAAIISANTN